MSVLVSDKLSKTPGHFKREHSIGKQPPVELPPQTVSIPQVNNCTVKSDVFSAVVCLQEEIDFKLGDTDRNMKIGIQVYCIIFSNFISNIPVRLSGSGRAVVQW